VTARVGKEKAAFSRKRCDWAALLARYSSVMSKSPDSTCVPVET
jgi:hypothetical protein